MSRVALARVAAAPVLRGLASTWRFRECLPDGAEREPRPDLAPAVYALWHGELLALTLRYASGPAGLGVMISHHRDGDIATRLVETLGAKVVRGSSSAGGSGALKRLAAMASAGLPVALTTDGPRGPAHRSKPGVIRVAALSGLPIIPVGAAAARSWRARSWDRFIVPRPFTRVYIGFGEPLPVPARVGREELPGWAARLDAAIEAVSMLCHTRAESA